MKSLPTQMSEAAITENMPLKDISNELSLISKVTYEFRITKILYLFNNY